MKSSKWISVLLIGTSLSGCVKALAEQTGQTPPTPAPSSSAGLAGAQGLANHLDELRAAIFAQNVTAFSQSSQDYSIEGDALAVLLAHATGAAMPQGRNYIEALKKLDPAEILAYGSEIFGDPTVNDDGFQRIDTLALLAALDDLRQAIGPTGEARAKARFDQRLKEWSVPILTAAHLRYTNDPARTTFQPRLDAVIGMRTAITSVSPLSPSADFGTLVFGLSEDTKVQSEAKKLLEGVSGSDAGQVLVRLQRLTSEDLAQARAKVKALIGSPELTQEEKSERFGAEFHKIDAGVALAGLAIDKVLGKTEDAKRFVKVATGVVSVAKIVSNLKLDEIGSQLLSGNLLGSATSVVEGLFGLGGPDAEEQRHQEIMSALGSIRSDIADFRAEMNSRFDVIDQRLDVIAGKLDQQLDLLMKLQTQSTHVLNEIKTLSGQIDGMQLLMEHGFRDLVYIHWDEVYGECLGPNSLVRTDRKQVTDAFVSKCLASFSNRALHAALMPEFDGTSQFFNEHANVTDLRDEKSELKLELLNGILTERKLISPLGPVASPGEWTVGVEAYLEIRMLFPRSPSVSQDRGVLEEMLTEGQRIQAALMQFGSVSVLKPLLAQYEAKFESALTNPADREEVTFLWFLMDRLLRVARPDDRFNRVPVALAFEGEDGERLPSGDDIDMESDLTLLRQRAFSATTAIRSMLDDAVARGETTPTRTIVDGTVLRLETLLRALR